MARVRQAVHKADSALARLSDGPGIFSPNSVDTLRGFYGNGKAAVLRLLCRAGLSG